MIRWLMVGFLVALALGVSIGASSAANESLVPSVENRGPRGIAALAQWLGEGQQVITSPEPLSHIPNGVATVVIAAPTKGELNRDEVEGLKAFVARGGTLVYLAPRTSPQVLLHQWLQLRPGVLHAAGPSRVTTAAGPLSGLESLALRPLKGVALDRPEALAVVADDGLWWLPWGAGEVWVGSGADLAENEFLADLGNSLFWARLGARGPVLFDEFHHTSAALLARPRNLEVTIAQFLLCALVLTWVVGPRLGPPREESPQTHRSGVEYVEAMANLTRRAGVEDELIASVKAQFGALSLPPEAHVHLEAIERATTFLTVSQHAAQIEQLLRSSTTGSGE